MRLRKSADNELEFRKKLEKDIHGFSFKKFILFIISELDEDKSQSSNSQISESEGDEAGSEDEEGASDDDQSVDAGELEATLNTIAGQTSGSAKDKRRSGFIVPQ